MTGFGRPPVAAVMAATLLCEVRADLDANLFSFPVIRGRILFLRLWSQGGGEKGIKQNYRRSHSSRLSVS